MDFTRMELEELNISNIKNGIIVLTNGIAMLKELPDYGGATINVLTHDGKATYIEESTNKKIKLV